MLITGFGVNEFGLIIAKLYLLVRNFSVYLF